jgi:hypothetical protein
MCIKNKEIQFKNLVRIVGAEERYFNSTNKINWNVWDDGSIDTVATNMAMYEASKQQLIGMWSWIPITKPIFKDASTVVGLLIRNVWKFINAVVRP